MIQILRIRLPHPIALGLHAAAVAEAMARLGVDVELVIPAGRPPDVDAASLPDPWTFYGVARTFAIRRIPYLPVRRLERTFEAGAALYTLARRADLCYVNDCTRAAAYAVRLGIPTIYHTHQYPKDARNLRTLEAVLAGRSLRRVVTNTEALARLIRENHRPRCDVRVAYNGVDLNAFGALDRADARRRLALGADDRIVCYLGHLYEGRGVDHLIEAARGLDARVLLVGGLPADVENLRRRLGDRLPANVEILGFVPREQVPQYLSAADVVAMPYTTKTLVYAGVDTTAVMNPMKMFEYMASGRPIVSSRLPAIEEVLRHDENALLVEPDRADTLRDGIATLLEDRARADRLARRAREDAVAHHSWDAHARTILEGLT